MKHARGVRVALADWLLVSSANGRKKDKGIFMRHIVTQTLSFVGASTYKDAVVQSHGSLGLGLTNAVLLQG